jgi:prephenate dehydrogenase
MSTHVAIIGLGLIGGSMARALAPHATVKAVEIHPATLKRAPEFGIDATKDLASAVAAADLVVIATPLGTFETVFKQVAAHLKDGALVVDVGSVKQTAVTLGQRYFPEGSFVGGHPMAGKEMAGLEASDPELFKDKTFILTPTTDAERQAGLKIQEILAPLGMEWLEMPPDTHDMAVAFTSHMPLLMAAATARIAQGAIREVPELPKLASSGFRDTTRLAMTNPVLGRDICSQNKDAILHAISAMRYQLTQIEIMVQAETSTAIEMMFEGVGKWRQELKL